jgi:serine/threonine protein kinase
VNGVLVLKQS